MTKYLCHMKEQNMKEQKQMFILYLSPEFLE